MEWTTTLRRPRVRTRKGDAGALVFSDSAEPGSPGFEFSHTAVTLADDGVQYMDTIAYEQDVSLDLALTKLISERKALRAQRRELRSYLYKKFIEHLREQCSYDYTVKVFLYSYRRIVVYYKKKWGFYEVRIPRVKWVTVWRYTTRRDNNFGVRIRYRTRKRIIKGIIRKMEWRYVKIRIRSFRTVKVFKTKTKRGFDVDRYREAKAELWPETLYADPAWLDLTYKIESINRSIGILRSARKQKPNAAQAVKYSKPSFDLHPQGYIPATYADTQWTTQAIVTSGYIPTGYNWFRALYGVDTTRTITSLDRRMDGFADVTEPCGNVTILPADSQSELDQFGTELCQSALAILNGQIDVSEDSFVAARSILELKDLPQSVKQGRDFIRFLGRIAAGTGGIRRTVVRTLGQAASLYLANQFAIQPTIADIKTVIKNGFEYCSQMRRGLSKLVDQVDPWLEGDYTLHLRKMVRPYSSKPIVIDIPDTIPASGTITKATNLGSYTPLLMELEEWQTRKLYPGQHYFCVIPRDALSNSGATYFFPWVGYFTDSLEQVQRYFRLSPAERFHMVFEAKKERARSLMRGYVVTHVKYSGLVFAHVKSADARLKLLNESWQSFLERTRLLQTMWELTPLSFVVDWFTTTNQLAHALQNLVSLNAAALDPRTLAWWASVNADVFASKMDAEYIEYFSSDLTRPVQAYGYDHTFEQANVRMTQVVTPRIPLQGKLALVPAGLSRYQRWAPSLDMLDALTPRVKVSLNRGKLLSLIAMLTPKG